MIAEKDIEMADEEKNEEEASSSGAGKKTMIIVLLALVVEAGLFFGAQAMLGGPGSVAGAEVEDDQAKEANMEVELQVHDGKHINRKSGKAKSCTLKLFVTVKQKHAEKAEAALKAQKNRIYDKIREIIGRAEPKYLNSGSLTTLRRQFREVTDSVLGLDEDGQPIAIKIIISSFDVYNADL